MSPNTRAIIVNSPNNPTGRIYPPETLGALSEVLSQASERAGRRVYLLSDESYCRILFDGRGFVVYGFTRDLRGKSACSGTCARAWPPYVVKSPPRAGLGVAARLMGTPKRNDGSLQVTYAGRPLSYYIGDRKPGQILCQNVTEFGGVWRVVHPNGRLVR